MECGKTHKTVIVKVTHACNLNCRYCCVGDNFDHQIISETTLDNLFKKLSVTSTDSTIIWHGGEPLIAGLDFYKKVIELQSQYPNHLFKNSLQTNGTLLTDEYLDFFQTNHFSIGFSLDGCKMSHNMNRPFKGGRDSFEITFKWYKEVERRGMQPGAICVINANTARCIKDIYAFAKKNHIAFKFNPQYPAGRASINVDLGLDNAQLANAYIELFDLWFSDKPEDRASINMFDNFVDSITKITNNNQHAIRGYDCAWANRCQKSFIGLATNGDVYPCGKFVEEQSFLYGNINEDRSLEEILNNDIREQFLIRHKEGVHDCKNCRYLKMCSSGCPHTANLYTNDIFSKNPFCESNLRLFNHIEKRLIEHYKYKDIFVEPINDNSTEYLVYSPLRGGCFIIGSDVKKDLDNYIINGVLPKNDILCSHLNQWAHQLPSVVRHYDIDTYNTCVILLTQQCNLQCSYCYAKASRSNQTVTKENIKLVVDRILANRPSSKKTFSFIGGGEPTIDWNLLTWSIEYIRTNQKNDNVIISVTTNGTLLNEERIVWLKQNNVDVGLSYDILPEIQNKVRAYRNGEGTYKTIDQTIKLLHRHNLYFRIRATISGDSVDYMPQMIEFIRDQYPFIKHVQLEPVQDKEQNVKSYYDRFVNNFVKAHRIGKLCGIDVYNMITHSIGTLKSQFCRGEFCLTPEGSIVACQRFSSINDALFPEFKYGQIVGGNIKIDDEAYKKVNTLFSHKLSNCESCFAQYNCAGLCTAIRSDLPESQVLEYCHFTKNLIKQMILQINNN